VAAVPPSNVMNSRRLIETPSPQVTFYRDISVCRKGEKKTSQKGGK